MIFLFFSLLLQCKFANSALLSLLSFSYFITPYDAQASSALTALIVLSYCKNARSLKTLADYQNIMGVWHVVAMMDIGVNYMYKGQCEKLSHLLDLVSHTELLNLQTA